MASSKTYECFQCKNNGFPGVQVYLAGKDEQGKAIRLEEDGLTPHTHKTKVPSQQQQQQQQEHQTGQPPPQKDITIADLALEIKLLSQKIDRVIDYLDRQQD
jgi:hypothetical protein